MGVEGHLWKRGSGGIRGGGYQRRYFVLDGNKMRYYKSPGGGRELGFIDLSVVKAAKETDRKLHSGSKAAKFQDFGFELVTDERVWYLVAESGHAFHTWFIALQPILGAAVRPSLVKVADGFVNAKDDEDKDDDSLSDSSEGTHTSAKPNDVPGYGATSASAAPPVSANKPAGAGAGATTPRRPGTLQEQVDQLQSELLTAKQRIFDLERENKMLTDRLELREVDTTEVLRLNQPLLEAYGVPGEHDESHSSSSCCVIQ